MSEGVINQEEPVKNPLVGEEISYKSLKEKRDNYSTAYSVWLDIVHVVHMIEFWVGMIGYPCLMVYLMVYTKYWYIALLNILWVYYDRETPHNGGRKISGWKSWSRKFVRDYYPVELVKTADIPADRNYIFAIFPHGIFCSNGGINFIHEQSQLKQKFPDIDQYSTTMAPNFYSPISRDLLLSMGIIAVSERGIVSVLTKKPNSGTAVGIVVGGAAEAFYSDPNEYKLVLKNRKGFVRVALKTGSPLVPVFGFGENQVYRVIRKSWLLKVQEVMYKISGYAPVIFIGRKFGPFATPLPKPTPLISVVGKPIDVPKIENPTKEQIDYYHQLFKDELYNLFEKYKEKYDVLGNKAKLSYI